MRIRIIRDPPPRVEGFDTAKYRQGQVYEVGSALGEALVRCKFAVPDESQARQDTTGWPRRD